MAQTHPAERGMSVIIPVRGRVAAMRAALASLREAARQSPEPVEILVVDDSEPADAARHRDACAQYGATYLRGPRHVGAKRNLAVARASYDLLFFTDSDCRTAPGTIERHIRRLRSAPAEVAAVSGPTVVEAGDSALYRVMSRSYLLNGDLERPAHDERLPWATTSNMAVRRDAFERTGGFPERPDRVGHP
jgi:GT2 family glycosyltransferase